MREGNNELCLPWTTGEGATANSLPGGGFGGGRVQGTGALGRQGSIVGPPAWNAPWKPAAPMKSSSKQVNWAGLWLNLRSSLPLSVGSSLLNPRTLRLAFGTLCSRQKLILAPSPNVLLPHTKAFLDEWFGGLQGAWVLET